MKISEINEALDNYQDQHKWEELLEEVAECYEYGAKTESYRVICKFFKYDDLFDTFTALEDYRNKNKRYDAGSPEYDLLYKSFKDMISRLEKEVPEEDLKELMSYL